MSRPDVLLLAAGFGTRLRPLTDHCPKPLLPIGGKPIIEWNLELLSRSGFRRVFINLHYLGEMIRAYVQDGAKWGLEVEYSEEPVILDTGGAIRAIEHRLRSADLVTFNSDILVDPDFPFDALIETHRSITQKKALRADPPGEAPAGSKRVAPDAPDTAGGSAGPVATMVLRADPDADRFGSFEISPSGRITRMLDAIAPDEAVRGEGTPVGGWMFTGIQVVSRALFDRMPPPGIPFSITRDVLRTAVRTGAFLAAYRYSGYWNDIGTPEGLAAASNHLVRT